jgi:hypothetical protein
MRWKLRPACQGFGNLWLGTAARFIKQEDRVVSVHSQFGRKRGGQPEFIERELPEIAPDRHRRPR